MLPDTHLPASLSLGADPAPPLPSPGFAMASQPQPLRPAVPCASATGTGLVAGSPEKGLCPRGRGICWSGRRRGSPLQRCRAGAQVLFQAWCGHGAPLTRRFSRRQCSPQAACPAQTPGAAQASRACQAHPAAPTTWAAAPRAALRREDEPPGGAPALRQRGQCGGAPPAPFLHPPLT